MTDPMQCQVANPAALPNQPAATTVLVRNWWLTFPGLTTLPYLGRKSQRVPNPEIKLQIRPFTEYDREALSQLYLESRQGTFTWLPSESFCLSDFDRDTAGETIWVAERGGILVGFVSVDDEDNFVHNLFVTTQWLGHGIGSQLLATSLANIGRPARLKCLVANARAIAFYLKKEWQKVGEGVSDDGKYVALEMDRS